MGEVGGKSDERYDVSQICNNGHVITEYSSTYPQHCLNYCDKCGEKTITSCPKCKGEIRGAYLDGWPSTEESMAPAYCSHCGTAYPWTETIIQSATELWVDESRASLEEAALFREALSDLTKNSPRTPLAASRFKMAMTKVGPAAAHAIRDVLVNILSELTMKSAGL